VIVLDRAIDGRQRVRRDFVSDASQPEQGAPRWLLTGIITNRE
jgi:hypothetical protein